MATETTEHTETHPPPFFYSVLTDLICARGNPDNPLGGAGHHRRWVGWGSVVSVVSVAQRGWGGRVENRP